MGLFGKSKEDTSQDQSIQEVWKWLKALNENQATLLERQAQIITNQNTLIANNDYFVKSTSQLQQKDMAHDKTDAEHTALIQSIKSMAKAIEETEEASESG